MTNLPDDEGLREEITRLRRERDAHQMDESDYVNSVMTLISQKIKEARKNELFQLTLRPEYPDDDRIIGLEIYIQNRIATLTTKQDTKENL